MDEVADSNSVAPTIFARSVDETCGLFCARCRFAEFFICDGPVRFAPGLVASLGTTEPSVDVEHEV